MLAPGGLALVQEVARQHGEQLIIDSEPGRGSVFALTLRRADKPHEARERVRA